MVTTINLRVDDGLKRDASEAAARYGLDLPTMLRLVLRQVANTGVVPLHFDYGVRPNVETIKALEDSDAVLADPSAPVYASGEEVLAAMGM